FVMAQETSLAALVEEVRKAAASMADGDERLRARVDTIEKSVNEIYRRVQRPGADNSGTDSGDVRKEASDFCVLRRHITVPKSDGGNVIYTPSSAEIDDAMTARTALTNLWRLADPNRLEPLQRKSLSSFSFGTNEFLLPPVMASQVLSCIVDPTDLASLVQTV